MAKRAPQLNLVTTSRAGKRSVSTAARGGSFGEDFDVWGNAGLATVIVVDINGFLPSMLPLLVAEIKQWVTVSSTIRESKSSSVGIAVVDSSLPAPKDDAPIVVPPLFALTPEFRTRVLAPLERIVYASECSRGSLLEHLHAIEAQWKAEGCDASLIAVTSTPSEALADADFGSTFDTFHQLVFAATYPKGSGPDDYDFTHSLNGFALVQPGTSQLFHALLSRCHGHDTSREIIIEAGPRIRCNVGPVVLSLGALSDCKVSEILLFDGSAGKKQLIPPAPKTPPVLTLTAIFPLGDVCESMTFGEAFAVYPSFETADYDADPEHSAPDSSANQFQALARVLTDLDGGAVLEKGLGAFLLFPSTKGRMLIKPLATHELMLPSQAELLPDPPDEMVAALRAALEAKVVRATSGCVSLPSRGVLRHAADRADARAAEGPKPKRSRKAVES